MTSLLTAPGNAADLIPSDIMAVFTAGIRPCIGKQQAKKTLRNCIPDHLKCLKNIY